MQANILIVEDDLSMANLFTKVLESNDLNATAISSGEEALQLLQATSYDLLLLDINLEGMDGFEVIKKLRQDNNLIPVIIVSGRSDDFDAVYGLNIGADDYIVKPINPITLGAKIKALIRRNKQNQPASDTIITAGPFMYDTAALHFYKNGQEIALSSKENALMRLFMENINHIFSRSSIYEIIWENTLVDENVVMVYINKLRHKIEDNPSAPKHLLNVRGLGYRFVV